MIELPRAHGAPVLSARIRATAEDFFVEELPGFEPSGAGEHLLLAVEKSGDRWLVTQTLHDPDGNHDWVIRAEVDLAASDEAGEVVVRTLVMESLTG